MFRRLPQREVTVVSPVSELQFCMARMESIQNVRILHVLEVDQMQGSWIPVSGILAKVNLKGP